MKIKSGIKCLFLDIGGVLLTEAYPQMVGLIRRHKKKYNLKIVVVSNEGRKLNAYRINKFKLYEFVDYFISSCYVHSRKPDPEIYQLAVDMAQTPVREIIYIENTPMFVRTAVKLGIKSILHTNYESTSSKPASLGLEAD